MNTPAPKSFDVLNKIAAYAQNGDKPHSFVLSQWARDCDSLLNIDPALAYLGQMMIGLIKADRNQVISFGKKVAPLILSSEQPDITLQNFVFATSRMGVYEELDIKKWFIKQQDFANNITEFDKILESMSALGLMDTASELYTRVTQESEDLGIKGPPTKYQDLFRFWARIKEQTKCGEEDFLHLSGIAAKIYTERLQTTIKNQRIKLDDEGGNIIAVLTAPDEAEVQAVIDADWEITEKIIETGSPLAEHVMFTIRY